MISSRMFSNNHPRYELLNPPIDKSKHADDTAELDACILLLENTKRNNKARHIIPLLGAGLGAASVIVGLIYALTFKKNVSNFPTTTFNNYSTAINGTCGSTFPVSNFNVCDLSIPNLNDQYNHSLTCVGIQEEICDVIKKIGIGNFYNDDAFDKYYSKYEPCLEWMPIFYLDNCFNESYIPSLKTSIAKQTGELIQLSIACVALANDLCNSLSESLDKAHLANQDAKLSLQNSLIVCGLGLALGLIVVIAPLLLIKRKILIDQLDNEDYSRLKQTGEKYGLTITDKMSLEEGINIFKNKRIIIAIKYLHKDNSSLFSQIPLDVCNIISDYVKEKDKIKENRKWWEHSPSRCMP